MKTLEAVIAEFELQTIDGRDAYRLSEFVHFDQWHRIGVKLADGATPPLAPRPWTWEEILSQLRSDVAFGFEKALNQRGISAGLMYEVVKMWMRILEDPLAQMEEYAQYGLPLFKAVAVKYGFENPIGDDAGDEYKYSAETLY